MSLTPLIQAPSTVQLTLRSFFYIPRTFFLFTAESELFIQRPLVAFKTDNAIQKVYVGAYIYTGNEKTIYIRQIFLLYVGRVQMYMAMRSIKF